MGESIMKSGFHGAIPLIQARFGCSTGESWSLGLRHMGIGKLYHDTEMYYDSVGRPWKIVDLGTGRYKTISYNDVNKRVTYRDEVGWQTILKKG